MFRQSACLCNFLRKIISGVHIHPFFPMAKCTTITSKRRSHKQCTLAPSRLQSLPRTVAPSARAYPRSRDGKSSAYPEGVLAPRNAETPGPCSDAEPPACAAYLSLFRAALGFSSHGARRTPKVIRSPTCRRRRRAVCIYCLRCVPAGNPSCRVIQFRCTRKFVAGAASG